MPSTPTTRNRLNLQGSGDNVGSWGGVLNTQVFTLLDESLDGVTTIAVAADVALSSQNYATDQSRRRILKLTGSPAASFTITIPGVEKFYLVHNTTSFSHTVKAGGTGVAVPPSSLTYVYCDGTNTFSPSLGVTAPVGTVMDYGGATAPTGWLLCTGQAVSRTTYTALFQVIGTAYGVGNGSTTFNIPDARGRFRLSPDNMGGTTAGRTGQSLNTVGASGGSQFLQAHVHASTASAVVTDWAATVTLIDIATGSGRLIYAPTGPGGYTTSTINVPIDNAAAGIGGSENIPPCLTFNTIIYAGV